MQKVRSLGEWRGIIFLAALTATGAVGCAGTQVGRVEGGGSPPKELPKELWDKFEVKESGINPAPAPSPVEASFQKPQATPKKEPKKHIAKVPAKAVGEPKAPIAAHVPFTYPNRRPAKDPIWLGEKMTFEITFFGVPAGYFDVEVMPYKEVNGRKVYHIQGVATSSKTFSLFYRLRDTIETFIDYEGMFSHRFHIVLDESKQTRDSLELNDSEKGKTFYWNRWNHYKKGHIESKDFFDMTPFPQDSLSALYYLRSIPLPDGAVVTFPVTSEGKTWEAVVTVLGREMMDTPMGKVQTIKLKPETKYQGVLQKRGDSFVWLTDDDRRFLVQVEAKVRIGSVFGRLKKVELGTAPN